MQNHYNLLYREEEREMLPLCAAEGLGVMPWSPLARGLLAGSRSSVADRTASTRAASDSYGHTLYDDDTNWAIVDAVRDVATGRGVSMAQVALAWLLSKPVVSAPIVGATRLSQLDEAIAAVDVELSADEVARLESPYRPQPVRGH
jgi:aryl-alcohol dehydrogenase-like predicted oxidoreductase